MKSSSLAELKLELAQLKSAELVALCLRLARFKKENKELLTYLLFEAPDEQAYIRGIQSEISELFGTVNSTHLYFAKKTLRKIVRVINKYTRYSGQKETEIELRLHFCRELLDSGIPFRQQPVILNLYRGQLKKIETTIASLHEDLQFEYRRELERLEKRG